MIYPRPGNITPNVPKFRYDPSELANAWQKMQSINLPVCLDENLVMCNSHDHLSKNHSKITHLKNAALH